jgi:hypothetical protein
MSKLETVLSEVMKQIAQAAREDARAEAIAALSTEPATGFTTTVSVGKGFILTGNEFGKQISKTMKPLSAKNGTKRASAKKVTPCRTPGCSNPSKGPRFRFMCADHRDTVKPKAEKPARTRKSKPTPRVVLDRESGNGHAVEDEPQTVVE